MNNQPERPWEDDPEESKGAEKPATESKTLWQFAGVIVVIAVVFGVWASLASGDDSSDDSQSTSGAEVTCERAIKEQVADAKIDHQNAVPMGDSEIIVSGYVTGRGGERVHFSCSGITNDGGDSWRSSNVVIGN